MLLATTTLYGWIEAAARDLAPLADRLLELLLRRTKIHADGPLGNAAGGRRR